MTGVAVDVAVLTGVLVTVGVFVAVDPGGGVFVGVAVLTGVLVGVGVDVLVTGVLVGVAVFVTGVFVGVDVFTGVLVRVGVFVAVGGVHAAGRLTVAVGVRLWPSVQVAVMDIVAEVCAKACVVVRVAIDPVLANWFSDQPPEVMVTGYGPKRSRALQATLQPVAVQLGVPVMTIVWAYALGTGPRNAKSTAAIATKAGISRLIWWLLPLNPLNPFRGSDALPEVSSWP